MKYFVIYTNCHGHPIEFFLNLASEFKNTYECRFVQILNYLNKPEITSLNEKDINHLKLADVVLCQYIQNDRDYLHHSNVLSYCKPEVRILMIPHHRFSGYSIISKNEFKFKINNWTHIPIEIYEHYTKSKNYDEFKLGFDNAIKSIEIKMSDSEITRLTNYFIDNYVKLNLEQSNQELNMSQFVIENYKTKQLFADDSHPTGIFFYELVKKILNLLKIYDIPAYDENNDYTRPPGSIWAQTYLPLLDAEKKKLNLEFDCYTPFVVMINTTSRKQASCLAEYYYFHIQNVLSNKANEI